MKRKLILSVGLVVCLLMAFALPMCAPAPQGEEGPPVEEEEELASSIKAYVTVSPEGAQWWAEFIKEQLGVTVKYSLQSDTELVAKLMAEDPNFSADMVITHGEDGGRQVQKLGYMLPYDSPSWRGESEVWKDPDNCWVNHGNWGFILIGNEVLLTQQGLEISDFKSWDDLLDPKWEGQIVCSSPSSSGTAFLFLYSIMTIEGFNKGLTGKEAEEAGFEWLEKFDKNVAMYTRSGSAPNEMVGRGEFMLGMGGDYAIVDRIAKGYPIVWTVPEEGIGYTGSFTYILQGCTELYTCQKIIDLIGTPEGCKFVNDFLQHTTKDPALKSVIYAEMPKFIPNLQAAWAYENKDRLIDEWERRIGRVAQ